MHRRTHSRPRSGAAIARPAASLALAAALLALAGGVPARGDYPGSFQPVGNLREARDSAQATLLTDGTVLVTGGEQQASAAMFLEIFWPVGGELFDPQTNQFTADIPMLERRGPGHRAVRLLDGRVLVVGGLSSDPTRRGGGAEIFDPATHTFGPAGNMALERDDPTATLLPDGRVLVAGGWTGPGFLPPSGPTAAAELFDPAGPPGVPSVSLNPTRVDFGSLYVGHTQRAPCYLTLTNTGSAPLAISSLRLGGADPGDFAFTSSLAAPLAPGVSWSFSLTFTPAAEGARSAVLTFQDNAPGSPHTVLFAGTGLPTPAPPSTPVGTPAGGLGGSGESCPAAPPPPAARLGGFEMTGNMTRPRSRHAAVALPDGRVVLLGGNGPDKQTLASVEIYDPRTGTFFLQGSLVEARADMAVSLLPDGRILVVGGVFTDSHGVDRPRKSVEIYDLSTGQSAITDALTDAPSAFAAAPLADGHLLVTGGLAELGTLLRTAEVVDPEIGIVSPTASMTRPRSRHTAVALRDGRVLIFGGFDGTAPGSVNSAEVFVPGAANGQSPQ